MAFGVIDVKSVWICELMAVGSNFCPSGPYEISISGHSTPPLSTRLLCLNGSRCAFCTSQNWQTAKSSMAKLFSIICLNTIVPDPRECAVGSSWSIRIHTYSHQQLLHMMDCRALRLYSGAGELERDTLWYSIFNLKVCLACRLTTTGLVLCSLDRKHF